MDILQPQFLEVGTHGRRRCIAYRWTRGLGPPLLWLSGFLSDMASTKATAVAAWAAEENLLCSDEVLLHPDPFPTRSDWCHERVRLTEPRLAAAARQAPLVIINHFPLRQDLAVLPRIPRFSIWCGTRLTEDWHTRFRAQQRKKVFIRMHHRRRRTPRS